MDYKEIKTFEDAVKALGIEELPPALKEENKHLIPSHVIAMLKLEIITLAINEGWSHIPDGRHLAYWPAFVFITPRKLDEMTYEEKVKLGVIPAGDVSPVYAGLASLHSTSAWSYSTADFGSRLAYKSSDRADYSGKQFIELWKEYLLIPI